MDINGLDILQLLWNLNPKAVLYWVAATFIFWFVYATLMTVVEKRKKYAKKQWQYWAWSALGYMLLIPGYPYDVIYNLTYGTLMFWQLPRRWEWTFTARLKRSVSLHTWRGSLAWFLCRYLVEPWDRGHCGQGYKP